jgi:acetoin utilization protein AcuB
MKLRDVMRADVTTVSTTDSAAYAWDRMHEANADYAVVLQDNALVGILSWHDLSGPAGGGHRRMGRTVGEMMHPEVVTATTDMTVAQAAALMRKRRVGALPILERAKLVGIVTTYEMLGILARAAEH